VKRPERVRVLGKQFQIKFHPEGSEEMEGNLGMCSYDKQIVYVEEGMPLENEQSTVFHELIHAVEEMMQLGLSEEHVKGLEVGLFALLRDNPSFVKYLMSK
jgi:Zn-dependent peptidase ImmA (M78 family)